MTSRSAGDMPDAELTRLREHRNSESALQLVLRDLDRRRDYIRKEWDQKIFTFKQQHSKYLPDGLTFASRGQFSRETITRDRTTGSLIIPSSYRLLSSYRVLTSSDGSMKMIYMQHPPSLYADASPGQELAVVPQSRHQSPRMRVGGKSSRSALSGYHVHVTPRKHTISAPNTRAGLSVVNYSNLDTKASRTVEKLPAINSDVSHRAQSAYY